MGIDVREGERVREHGCANVTGQEKDAWEMQPEGLLQMGNAPYRTRPGNSGLQALIRSNILISFPFPAWETAPATNARDHSA
jgi:hypothetical protein